MQWDNYNDWLWSLSTVGRNYINGDIIEIADVNEKVAELKDWHHHWGKEFRSQQSNKWTKKIEGVEDSEMCVTDCTY